MNVKGLTLVGALALGLLPNACAQVRPRIEDSCPGTPGPSPAPTPMVTCVDSQNTTTCTIETPLVTRQMTTYDGCNQVNACVAINSKNEEDICNVFVPRIHLFKGDQVTIMAEGCVQVGGDDGWYRYVDPQGSGDFLYRGTLGVAAKSASSLGHRGQILPVPLSMQELLLHNWQPFWITADQDLRLGYNDDAYLDNGYWGQNTATQCNGVGVFGGNARVVLQIQHNAPEPGLSQLPKCWDVVPGDPTLPDPFDASQQQDMNALLFNPQWGWQTLDPLTVNGICSPALVPSVSLPPKYGDCESDCSSQPTNDDIPILKTNEDFRYMVAALQGCLLGHRNWMVVGYHGPIYFIGHDKPFSFSQCDGGCFGDDDYNFAMETPSISGDLRFPFGATGDSETFTELTGQNRFTLKLEFNSSETIDHFVTKFWREFHHNVDQDIESARAMVNGKEAIVIGLLGLDLVHGGRTEIHPVLALAIHTNATPQDDTWAIFARNFGNEGFCSEDIHYANFQDLILRLPHLDGTFGPPGRSTGSEFRADNDLFKNWDFTFDKTTNDSIIRLHLPPPPGSGDGARVHGELHLQWSGPGPRPSPARDNTAAASTGIQMDDNDDEPEVALTKLWAQLTPRQQAIFRAVIPPPVPPSPDTFQLVPRDLDTPPQPASTPPALSSSHDPRQSQRFRDLVMGLCAAFHGRVPSDVGSCMLGDLNADGKVDCDDLAIVKSSLGKSDGQNGFDARADTNGDGVVDVNDFTFVMQNMPAGTGCSVAAPSVFIQPAETPTFYSQLRLTSVASDPNGFPLVYQWRTITKTAAIIHGDTPTPDVQFSDGIGVYTFEVKITNAAGLSSTSTISINYIGR